jgi:RNA polymerase sigma factor (sigma-70 family)
VGVFLVMDRRADPALADFCKSEWPRLVGSLSLYVGTRELAEDLAQETLLRVCRRWRTVRHADSPSAWAHRVAFNLAKSNGRREATWRRLRPRFEVPANHHVEHNDADIVSVRDAVTELPLPQRAAIVLRYFAGMSVREVAEVMHCPENTVKTHTRRGLESLRRLGLTDDGDSESRVEELR